MGEALVDFISLKPEKDLKLVREFYRAPGGAVCNVAVGLARLGVNVSLITKLGTDPFGEFLREFLKKEGVDISKIKLTSEHLTPLVFVALDEKRTPSFFFYGEPGADRLLSPEEISEKDFSGIKVFHFGTISLSQEPARSATLKALKLAKKKGARLSFDPNFRLHLWEKPGELREITQRLVPQVDLVKLNQDELDFLTQKGALEDRADQLVKAGAKLVIITLGEKGAYYHTADYQGYVSGFKIKPVDTTGAGDAFTSAMIAWLIKFPKIPPEKREIEKAVKFANAFAGLSTRKIGAIEGLCTWQEVEDFLKQNLSHN